MILGFDRRYVFLPVVGLVGLILASYVVVQAGQARLIASAKHIQAVGDRLTLLGQFERAVTIAESSQRGFLLTNDTAYLQPYEQAIAEINRNLDALEATYAELGAGTVLENFGELRALAGQKVGEMELTIAYQKTRGPDTGRTLVRTDVGARISASIRDLVSRQRNIEAEGYAAISREASRNIFLNQVITGASATLNVLLVIAAGFLVTREIKRRVAAASQVEVEKASLEKEVAARTAELSALSTHIQDVAETERAAVARELHDELGGLLVAIKMDLSALRRKLNISDPDGNRRWDRVMAAIDAGVDIKRRVVEQLRPTLLDNMGLYAAMRWQLDETCRRAGLACTESLPDHELPISREAAIAIFRMAQESMTNILKHARASAVHLDVRVADDEMVLTIRDDGVGVPPERLKAAGTSGLANMRQRVRGLGGSWRAGPGPDGKGTEIEVRLPLDRIQIAPA